MSTLSKHQILLVDDEPSVREILELLLSSAGYEVATAEDGFRALLALREMTPDAIVSDLNMPRMSGFDLLSVVHGHFPKIVKVAMSGAYQGDDLPSGVIADGFYAKGEPPKKLLNILEQLLRTTEREEVPINANTLQCAS
jgi:CheY-like chemotaxis protein